MSFKSFPIDPKSVVTKQCKRMCNNTIDMTANQLLLTLTAEHVFREVTVYW